MEKVSLKELKMTTRQESLTFLKKLWREEGADCPFCENPLEILHQKAKKNNCDWQCRTCQKVFRTIDLLNELNEQMPV